MPQTVTTLAVASGLCTILAACGGGGGSAVVGGGGGVVNLPSVTTTNTSRPGSTTASGPVAEASVTAASGVPLGAVLSEAKGCSIPYTVTEILTTTPSSADPLSGELWHLKNTGTLLKTSTLADINVINAWTLTKGQGVRVVVVDRGVELTHQDLAANVVPNASYNYYTKTAWPLPCSDIPSERHGTEVAGLIAARDLNGKGGSGVSPQAGLVAFNPLDLTDADVANALNRDQNLNSIYNNSWGSADDGFLHTADAAFEAAISSGIANGRNGKGSIFVFSAGNGGSVQLDNKFFTTESSNFDGYVNKLGIIPVCSVDSGGIKSQFSESGSNLLVCAPTDIGSMGLRTTSLRNTYVDDFIGTSGSTPQVSGVVALMLAVNPNLTWRDVQRILAQTAKKTDPSDAGWVTSGNGLSFNYKYGFGLVDASAAVSAAQSWVSVGGSATQKQCASGVINANLNIPDATSSNNVVVNGTPAVSVATIATTCAISEVEFVEIEFTTSHSNPADLRIELQSPSNTKSTMVTRRRCGDSPLPTFNPCRENFQATRMSSMRHLREPALGNWSLILTDESPVATGRLVSWSLKVWGK